MTSITPAFQGQRITICFAVDGKYLPALSVAIQSIINHASELKKYDICVLHAGLGQARVRKVERMARKNVAIRFFCVNEMVGQDRIAQLYATQRFPKEACFRFFIPKVFGEMQKVLYIDCDVVVNRDVAELFGEHLSNETYMGIVHDTYAIYTAHSDETYYREKLGLRQPRDYFQSGVMLLNLTAMRNDKVAEKILQAMREAKNLRFPDQDILNMVCEGHVQYLDGRWNVEYHIPLCAPDYRQVLTAEETAEYERCYADPWILHFCGGRKPWTNPMYPLSEIFWQYARLSPFYEEIFYTNIKTITEKELKEKIEDATKDIEDTKNLVRSLKDIIEKTDTRGSTEKAELLRQLAGMWTRATAERELQQMKETMREMAQLGDYRRKLKRVRWRVHFSWGKRKQRYLARKKQLKDKILFIEKFIKTK